MPLRLIQGGLARGAPPPPSEPRLSGAFVRRPKRPPPPRELDSSFGVVALSVALAAALLLAGLV